MMSEPPGKKRKIDNDIQLLKKYKEVILKTENRELVNSLSDRVKELESKRIGVCIKIDSKDVQYEILNKSTTIDEYLISKNICRVDSVCRYDGNLVDTSSLIGEYYTAKATPLKIHTSKGTPKPIKKSASAVSKDAKVDDMFENHPVFPCTLAYELKKAYTTAKNQIANKEENVAVHIMEQSFVVSHHALQVASRQWHQALNMGDKDLFDYGIRHSRSLLSTEMSFTGLCVAALARLVDSEFASIWHQGPTHKKENSPGNSESADIYGARLHDGLVTGTFVIGDGKRRGDYIKAVIQTAKYIHDIMTLRNSDVYTSYPPILGIPFSPEATGFYVFVMSENKLWGMEVVKSTCDDLALFALMYAGCQFMIHNAAITYEAISKPFLYNFRHISDRVFVDNRTEEEGNSESPTFKVWKFFEKNTNRKVNLPLLNALFGDTKFEHEVIDDIEVLKSNYEEGTDQPGFIYQYKGVCETLIEMHDRGYVHGDVRPENMIFFGNTSYLIDFDLSDQENAKYPEGYKCGHDDLEFWYRHCDALPFKEMKKEHDIFALQQIMEKEELFCQNKDIIKDFQIKKSLQELIKDLEKEERESKRLL